MNQHPKLLVVDDDRLLLHLLENLIRQRFRDRVELMVQSDSAAARQWIGIHRPEVVVTDLDMPEVNGCEVALAAKTANPSAAIILFSGLAEEYADHFQANYGVADCIPKSKGFERLLAAISHRLEGLRRRSPVTAE